MLADMTSSDMTSSDKASSSLKLGGDGPLSPTLKLMMQKYAADDAAHSRKISESSDHSNTSAVPPHPVVNGHHSIPPPPPPPAFGTSSVAANTPPGQQDTAIGGDLAAAIASIQLKKRPSVVGGGPKVSTPPLLPQTSMDSMMNDLNKKLLARKKLSEASAINLDKSPSMPKYKSNVVTAPPPSGIRTPPVTPSKQQPPFHRGPSVPASNWRDNNTATNTNLGPLKEELSKLIREEVRAAKDDIIKIMRQELRGARSEEL